jgi:ligand-binding sensor domain-containing protein/signal transduction histidine kinase
VNFGIQLSCQRRAGRGVAVCTPQGASRVATTYIYVRPAWGRGSWSRAVSHVCASLMMLLALTTSLRALDPQRELAQYGCRTWTTQDGLPVNGVAAIMQTDDGFLWLGANKGLVRFDGTHFKSFDLRKTRDVWNSRVRSLVPAGGGAIWVGLHESGFGFFDGHEFVLRSREDWGGAHIDVHNLLRTRDGALWVAANNLTARIQNDVYTPFADANGTSYHAWALAEARDGAVWIGTIQQGVFRWSGGALQKLGDPDLDRTMAFAIAEGLDGTIWVGTNAGVFAYGADGQRKHHLLRDHQVRAMVIDRHGAVWIGSDNGLYRFFHGELTSRRKETGLASGEITALFFDREESLWVGTRAGLSQLTDVKFPIFAPLTDGIFRQAISVAPSRRGGVTVSHSRGVSHIDRVNTWLWPGSNGTPVWTKRVLESRSGDIYATLADPVLMVIRKGELIARMQRPMMVVALVEDSKGVIASEGGSLFRVSPDGFVPFEFAGPHPEFLWIQNLHVARDESLWVATVNGVFRIKDGNVRRWAEADGLTDLRVVTFCEDADGTMWAGLLNGIARIKNDRLAIVGRTEGLLDDDIYGIAADDHGYLWVNSARGIFRVSRRTMNECADGLRPKVECQPFDGPDSLLSVDKGSEERVAAKSADGRIWFPTAYGTLVIDPARIGHNPVPPPVHIDRVIVNGGELAGSSASVAAGRGEFEAHFTALSFVAPSHIRFRYQLVGHDETWTEVTHRRMAVYTNLRPGKYEFKVMAANADGVWSTTPASYSFELQPHFTQTRWFVAIVSGAVLGLLGGAYWFRDRQLKQNRAQLEAEVKRRTAELAAANTALQHEVDERTRAEAQLKARTVSLENEIAERTRIQSEMERVQRELIDTSRRAGMAEVAIGVLHNVGNVLNSVNVSATVLIQEISNSRMKGVANIAALLEEHASDLPKFFSQDPRGQKVVGFIRALADHLDEEQTRYVDELSALRRNIEHINDIVAMQQNYAMLGGVVETFAVKDVVEDSLRIVKAATDESRITWKREYAAEPALTGERHKLMQILVNLLRNGKEACERSDQANWQVTVRVAQDGEQVRISVSDNGVGIAAEHLTRVFAHGFTTRKNGHGFGLHSCALSARDLGGSLTVESAGVGKGATFVLEIPLRGSRAD